MSPVPSRPDRPAPATQTTRPVAAVLRTIVAAAIGLIPIIPEIVKAYGLESVPWIAGVVGVIAATGRVLTLPEVEDWLQTYAPWLSAAGDGTEKKGRHRVD